MIKISEFKHLNELDEIYSSSEYSYPLSNPEFLTEWKDFIYPDKLLIATVFANKKITGYLPIVEHKDNFLFRVFKPWAIFLPIILSYEVEPEGYRELFREFIKSISKKLFVLYDFNFLDPFKEIERGLLSYNALKIEFVAHITDVKDFKLHKKMRKYVKRAEDYGLWIDSEITDEAIKQFVRCRNETLNRKELKFDTQPQKLEKNFRFYRILDEREVGKLLLTRDAENKVLSGGFEIYDKNTTVGLHGATSIEGLQKYAGYFRYCGDIQFCKESGIKYFDSHGCYKNSPSIDFQNLYMFKRRWGEEVDISQYIKCSNIVKRPVLKYWSKRAHVELPSEKTNQVDTIHENTLANK